MGKRCPSGNHPSFPKKTNCTIKASQKTGNARPEIETKRETLSISESRLTAEATPSGTPIRVARMKA